MSTPGALAVTVTGAVTVGQHVTSEWFDGGWAITQGWGPSAYDGEPAGHGYAHWHAGADVGLNCGTVLKFPHGLLGVARWVDNPGGYGTGLRVELYTMQVVGGPSGQAAVVRKRTWDVWLGHLRQRSVPDGTELRGGDHIAVSNNTGNSTGCHLHFEVRPAGARYGTDVDPSSLLLMQPTGDPSQSSSGGNPYNDLDPRHAIWELQHQISGGITQAEATLLGVGQAGLGASMLMGGLVIVAFGLRGQSGAQLGAAVRGTVGGVQRRRAGAEFSREKQTQGAIAADVKEQAQEATGTRRNTIGAYRAGLISRQVAQKRLGEPIRPTGPRPKRLAFGRGMSGPGTYRKGRGTIEVKDPARAARRSRVRTTHQRDFDQIVSRKPAAQPTATEIPF